MKKAYCSNFREYKKRPTNATRIGEVLIGGEGEIVVQTMTNTPCSDIEATTQQVISAYKAGAQIVRITVPSMNDVVHLAQVKQKIDDAGFKIPLVADVHFNQRIAFEAAKVVDKVRINPGNFADSKNFNKLDYSQTEYTEELERLENAFVPLLKICKQHNTALRIGSNHGSLSDRIMSRYGDTPEGMAESAMEFLRICKKEQFERVIISMKASNTMVMVQATRLLLSKMNNEDMLHPLHLGVTEAGEGEDGRIKSALGIGALLADGIGDTIRVSLTEPPENEIPVAQKLVDYIKLRELHAPIKGFGKLPINPYSFKRRATRAYKNIGGTNVPVVFITGKEPPNYDGPIADYFIDSPDVLKKHHFLQVNCNDIQDDFIAGLPLSGYSALIVSTINKNGYSDQRSTIFRLMNAGSNIPVILHRKYRENYLEDLQIKASADFGGLLLDGLVDGIWLENEGKLSQQEISETAFGILQASRMRVTKPEYISCPSCGRTQFDIQHTIKEIRSVTQHLKGLKIGIMGCIVNGLGEMADSDYGYIGTGKGKVNLYFNKTLVKKNIDEAEAVRELVQLIKEKGDWVEPI